MSIGKGESHRTLIFLLKHIRHPQSRHAGKPYVFEGTAKSPWAYRSIEALEQYSERQQQGCDIPLFAASIAFTKTATIIRFSRITAIWTGLVVDSHGEAEFVVAVSRSFQCSWKDSRGHVIDRSLPGLIVWFQLVLHRSKSLFGVPNGMKSSVLVGLVRWSWAPGNVVFICAPDMPGVMVVSTELVRRHAQGASIDIPDG